MGAQRILSDNQTISQVDSLAGRIAEALANKIATKVVAKTTANNPGASDSDDLPPQTGSGAAVVSPAPAVGTPGSGVFPAAVTHPCGAWGQGHLCPGPADPANTVDDSPTPTPSAASDELSPTPTPSPDDEPDT